MDEPPGTGDETHRSWCGSLRLVSDIFSRRHPAAPLLPGLIGLIITVSLALTACNPGGTTTRNGTSTPAGASTSSATPAPQSAATSAHTAVTPGATSSTSPAPSPSPSRSPSSALKQVSGGTVTDTKSSSASGSGSAAIRYTRKGDFGVVVRLDCSRCRGRVVLTSADRMSPFARTTAPIKEAYLVSVSQSEPAKHTLQLTASGRWRLRIISWNDLPAQRGRRSGHGSTVLYLGEHTSRLAVSYRPAGRKDQFDARIFTPSNEPLIFGNDEAFDEVEKIDLPGVIAISTHGSWTLDQTRPDLT